MKDPQNLTINISASTVIKSILLMLVVWLLFVLKGLVLVVLTAVVIAASIEPAVRWFLKYKLPRVVAVLVVYLLLILVLAGIFYFFVPTLLDEFSSFTAALPQVLDTIDVSNPLKNAPIIGSQQAVQDFSLTDVVGGLQSSVTTATGGFFAVVSSIFGGVLSFVLIIVFSFYFAAQESNVTDFLRVITPVKHEEYVLGLWKRSQSKIGKWMQGQLILGLIVGVLVYLGLTVLGVPYALLLAILAALFELIPVFGPILAAIPAVLVAFVAGGTSVGLLTIALFAIIQQFENHLIYPLVVTKIVGVPPLLVILALIIGAQLAGFLGIILSVPAAAVIQEFVGDFQRDKRKALEKSQTKSA